MSKQRNQSGQKTLIEGIGKYLNSSNARAVLVLMVLACYGNTWFNYYSLDDGFVVTNNEFVQKGIAGIPEILANPYCVKCGNKVDYRPLSGVIFAIEHQFFGGNPHISHVINVLLFAFLALIIYQVLIEVFGLGALHSALPFLVTLFYVVHPANTETVASIKNRDQILSMSFAMGAMLYSYRFFFQKRAFNAVMVGLLMLLSYLTKMTLSLPVTVIICIIWIFYGFKGGKRSAYLILFLLLLSGALFLINMLFGGSLIVFEENPLVNNDDLWLTVGFIFKTLLFYIKFMFFPYPFRFYYGYDMIPLVPFNTPVVLLSALLHLGLFAWGTRLFFHKQVLGLLIICYLANISVYSNILPVSGIVSERILFIAGLWLVAAVLVLVWNLTGNLGSEVRRLVKPTLAAGGVAVFITFCVLTVQRNFQWKDYFSLAKADIGHLENSALANFQYGRMLYRLSNGEISESRNAERLSEEKRAHYLQLSKHHFRRVVQIIPGYSSAYYYLGMIYEYDIPNRDSAFYCFKIAIVQDPKSNPSRFQLAKQYFFRGEKDKAEALFSAIYNELPQDTLTLFFYVQVLFDLGKEELALAINEELLNLAPHSYLPYYNYGLIYKFKGNLPAAVGYLEKAVQLGYSDDEIKNVLLNYYIANQMDDKVKELQFAP